MKENEMRCSIYGHNLRKRFNGQRWIWVCARCQARIQRGDLRRAA